MGHSSPKHVEIDKYKYTEKKKLCTKLVYVQDYTEMQGQQNVKKTSGFFAVLGGLQKNVKLVFYCICCSQVLNSVGRPSVAQATYTLKATKFGTKSYEICEPSTGYVLSFFIYA